MTELKYNNYGQLIMQKDARADTVVIEYDLLGRKYMVIDSSGQTTYTYSNTGAGSLAMVSKPGGAIQKYSYDELGRLTRVSDSIPGEISMVTKYRYDIYNNNTSIIYPSGLTVSNVFDSYGYLSEIWNGTAMLWKINSENYRGQPLNYNLGNLVVSRNYTPQGRVSSITTGQMKQSYNWDSESGNLTSRDYRILNSATGLTEDFVYDSFDRLTSSAINGTAAIALAYSSNGNITSKSDAGTYGYDATQVNALTSLTGYPSSVNTELQKITYNDYNFTTDINEGDKEYSIRYNPFNQRIRTEYKVNSVITKTKYYSGAYEKVITSAGTKELHYISSPDGLVAILVKQGSSVQTYFAETDHLGSIIGLLNADGTYAEKMSFDPWGRRRNPVDWSYNNVPAPQITDRGFTGHEHLDDFGLINMNGRMYDPVLGRFLGVDPVVADYNSSQAYNGYSYCINNPLNKTDPTGFTYYKLNANNEWVAFEYNPFGGGEANFRIASNGGICEDRSPGFEENMTSKGYVYVRNQYGIGRWVKKNNGDDPSGQGRKTFFPEKLYSEKANKGDVYVDDNAVLNVFTQSVTPKGFTISTWGFSILDILKLGTKFKDPISIPMLYIEITLQLEDWRRAEILKQYLNEPNGRAGMIMRYNESIQDWAGYLHKEIYTTLVDASTGMVYGTFGQNYLP